MTDLLFATKLYSVHVESAEHQEYIRAIVTL